MVARSCVEEYKQACDREGSGVAVTGHTTTCSCDACREAKQTRASIPKVRETPSTATRPFQHIYSDVKGKIATADFWGRRYFITFTCEVTRYTCVYFMRKKSEARSKFLLFLQWVRQQSDSDGKPYRVHQLRTDDHMASGFQKKSDRQIFVGYFFFLFYSVETDRYLASRPVR